MCNACKTQSGRQGQGPRLYPKRREGEGHYSPESRSTKAIVERSGTRLETNREKVNRLRDEAFLRLAEATTIRHAILRRPVVSKK
jgi:hypothetical protein